MHSSISDKVVKNLNKLRSKKQSTKFKEAFHNLSTKHQDQYIEYFKAKQCSSAMSGILNALKKEDASRLFNQLLQENKEFAFNTLDCINPTNTLFKTLFSALDKNQYIEHVKAKQGSKAMSGILNALKKKDASRLFNQLLQENKEFAFNTLDCINPQNDLFKTLFSALDKNQYIEHVKAKLQGSSAMSGILNALKKEDASRLFNQLLQENKEFAFNTLDCINPAHTLFKTLFSELDRYEKEYIEHVKAKLQGSKAMSGILNALKKEDASRLFNQLLQENKEFAFNTLDCINPAHTLFKTLFSELDRYEKEYIEHVKAKPQGSSAMSGILNALKKEDASRLFNQLLQENKEFAFNTLDCISPTNTLFKTLFSELDRYKNEYIEHVKAKLQGSSAMSGILNELDEKEALSIFNQLPQEFAFNTLDCISPTSALFQTLFDKLDKNQYIEHVKKKQCSRAMFGILNALDEKEALSIFSQLLQENKKLAFNTLDCISPTSTLFKTLFDQLNPQQKEDYRVHLEAKSTAKAKYTLRNFYSSNLEEICTVEPPAKRQCIIPFPGFAELHNQFSNIVPEDSTISSSLTSNENISDSLEGEQLSPESYYNYLRNGVTSLQSSIVDDLPELNLSPITPAFEETVVEHTFDNRPEFSYENEPLVQNRDDLPVANFSPISPVSEETVVEYAFDTRPEFSSDKESQLCSQIVPPFEGFAEFHNQFRNIVPEDSTVNDSSVPEEHTSLEGELTFLDSQINGGEPLTRDLLQKVIEKVM